MTAAVDVRASTRLHAVVALMRPHQWIKNIVLFAPLFFTPRAVNLHAVLVLCAGFVCFAAVSSGIYAINDICDRETDRLHPKKRFRPIAAGTVSVREAVVLTAALIAATLVCAY